MSLSDVDRELLQRCLDRAPRAWQDFVDRFLGLVVHVANHTAESRNVKLDEATRDDLVAEVFLAIVAHDLGVLRKFRRNCSLATYLTVISRRVITRRLYRNQLTQSQSGEKTNGSVASASPNGQHSRIENREEVERLLMRLDPKEASVVRLFHLEGKTYAEISREVGIAENSIGPVLSRARAKMREAGDQTS